MRSLALEPTKALLELINETKAQHVSWIRFDEIKGYLDRENVRISQNYCLNSFFVYLRNRREVPTFTNTYFATMDEFVYAVSKSQYGAIYRLYRYSIRRGQWTIVRDEPTTIVRLYNVIRLIDEQEDDDEIVEFLYSTGQVRA
nr:hypothetical protein [Clostridia bacterium]